ncbi:MAG: LamG domain-containing protein [Candidatus Nanoarchaeia archaeon]|nr:LamG domain-containing protein [Candidatus Nanoarchaeia archaeon]MDD5740791.1 LamG domain-containing protein [Candidatus Nanoarchaeia archaeon]
MKKRGQSEIISIILIILVVLVMIALVWIVLNGVVRKNSSEIYIETLKVESKIEKVSINLSSNKLQVDFSRGPDNVELAYFKVILIDENENSHSYVVYNLPQPLETRSYVLNISDLNIKKINLYPVTKNNKAGVEEVYIIQGDESKEIDGSLEVINEGEGSCIADCNGKVCGSNGCGGSCGSCGGEEVCNSTGQCIANCTDNCLSLSYNCGIKTICGISTDCGTCSADKWCNLSNQCQDCQYTAWQSIGCGKGSCLLSQMYQNRSAITGTGCSNTTNCAVNETCSLISGAVSYWNFDINFNDVFGRNNLSPYEAYIQNGAVILDGINDYVRNNTYISNLPSGNQARTVSIWLNWAIADSVDVIFGYGNGIDNQMFGAYVETSKYLSFWTYNSDINTFMIINPGNWTQIAFVYNGTHLKTYKNGTLIRTDSKSINTSVKSIAIGKNIYTNLNFLNGSIDDLMIFNRSLNDSEIKAIYNYQLK